MKIRRTALTVAASVALVLLPASAFAGTSGDQEHGSRDGYHHVDYPKYAPPCPDEGDHRPPHYERPKPPPSTTTTTTVTVTRTLHTL